MSTTADLLAAGKRYYVPVYKPRETILERGLGARVWDREGKEYVDFGAGIAVFESLPPGLGNVRGKRRGVAEEGADAERPLGVIAPQPAAGHKFPVVAVAMRSGFGVFEAAILLEGVDIGRVEQRVEDFVVGISH